MMADRFGTSGPLREAADRVDRLGLLGGDVEEVTFRLAMRWMMGDLLLDREALHRLRTAVASSLVRGVPEGDEPGDARRRTDVAMLVQADRRMGHKLREGDVG